MATNPDLRVETTFCSGGDCIEVVYLARDWYRIHSTINPHIAVAVTGAELRAFILAVKAGQFDDIAALGEKVTAS